MMSSREVGTHTTSPEAETSGKYPRALTTKTLTRTAPGPQKLKLKSVSDEIVARDEAGGEHELRWKTIGVEVGGPLADTNYKIGACERCFIVNNSISEEFFEYLAFT